MDILLPLYVALPNLLRTLQLALTLPVSSASCERSFSCLKLVKSYLRNLAVLSIENDLSSAIRLDKVVDRFNSVDKNRRILLS